MSSEGVCSWRGCSKPARQVVTVHDSGGYAGPQLMIDSPPWIPKDSGRFARPGYFDSPAADLITRERITYDKGRAIERTHIVGWRLRACVDVHRLRFEVRRGVEAWHAEAWER